MNIGIVEVAAAVIVDQGRILAARRRTGLELAGYWEFPGGKVEPGETRQQCLIRELLEELGVSCRIGTYLGQSFFDYGTKRVRLHAYLARVVEGTFSPVDHDQLLWLPPQQLSSLPWAPADIPLLDLVTAQLLSEKSSHHCPDPHRP